MNAPGVGYYGAPCRCALLSAREFVPEHGSGSPKMEMVSALSANGLFPPRCPFSFPSAAPPKPSLRSYLSSSPSSSSSAAAAAAKKTHRLKLEAASVVTRASAEGASFLSFASFSPELH